tara:strand:- start:1318 stop:1683 length:366 start_codon:yes stop_codon:yes gene_type:complete
MTLTPENFSQFALNCYDNPQCVSIKEFESDIKRFRLLNTLFKKYKEKAILRERLILNHIIIIYNIFGTNATPMLFFSLNNSYYDQLTTFLIYLNHMPVINNGIHTSDITLDTNIIAALRKI